MFRRIFGLLLFLSFPAVLLLSAQSPPPKPRLTSSRLTAVRVLGSVRFTESELAKATGLVLGTSSEEAVLQEAAGRLADSGMFTEVVWRSMSSPAGTEIEFRVADADKFVPAEFDNFLWLPRQELLQRIRTHVPLFRGQLPLAGSMADRVAQAVQAELQSLGVPGTVKFYPHTSFGSDQISSFLFTVEGVPLPIQSIQFPGASPDFDSILHSAAQDLIGNNFRRSNLQVSAALSLLPHLLRRGYLHASFEEPVATLTSSGGVQVLLPLQQGPQYRLAGVEWEGQTAFSEAELTKSLHLAPGAVADQVQLQDDLGGIEKVYGTKGYMRARLQEKPSFDEQNLTVTYHVTVKEGDQFRMGALAFEGLNETSAERMREMWRLQPGTVYDSSYPALYLQEASRRLDFRALKVSYRFQPDLQTRQVNVTISFSPN